MPGLPIVLAFLSVLLASHAGAQPPVQRTAIRRTTRDSVGAIPPGVSVRLAAQNGTFARNGVRRGGRFLLTGIPAGECRIEASLDGFQVVRRDNVPVTIGGSQSIDLVFEVGVLSEVVTVSAQEAVPIRWNAWMEPPGAGFHPATLIEPGQQYSFVVDLAGVDYATTGVTPGAVSTAMSEHLEEWLEDLVGSRVDVDLMEQPRQESCAFVYFASTESPWHILGTSPTAFLSPAAISASSPHQSTFLEGQ